MFYNNDCNSTTIKGNTTDKVKHDSHLASRGDVIYTSTPTKSYNSDNVAVSTSRGKNVPHISGAGAALYGLYEKNPNMTASNSQTGDWSSNRKNKLPGAGAALHGLYEKNTNLSMENTVRWSPQDTLTTKLKCKLEWYFWMKYTNKFHSYYDYKRYFINNKK